VINIITLGDAEEMSGGGGAKCIRPKCLNTRNWRDDCVYGKCLAANEELCGAKGNDALTLLNLTTSMELGFLRSH
jgi:hypothetical protein